MTTAQMGLFSVAGLFNAAAVIVGILYAGQLGL